MKIHLILCFLLSLLFFQLGHTQTYQNRHVLAYYYPWYGANFHWSDGYLRSQLSPAQQPLLGEYDSRNEAVIHQHLDWSEKYGIDTWVCSWWGENSFEDIAIKDHIMPQLTGRTTTFAIFYESPGLVNPIDNDEIVFENQEVTDFRAHFAYLAQTYFEHPNYLRINGRPVVFIYLTRIFQGQYMEAYDLMRQDLQQMGYDVYLIGDEVYWHNPDANRIAALDAITAYSMHGPTEYAGYPSDSPLFTNSAERYNTFKTVADNVGTDFIPNVLPGFNDRGVRPEVNHYIIPNQFSPTDAPASTLCKYIDVAIDYIDNDLNMVAITSFNEWHEDTQIEPVHSALPTTQDMSSNGTDLTDGYSYEGYGFDYFKCILERLGTDEMVALSTDLQQLDIQITTDNSVSLSWKYLFDFPTHTFQIERSEDGQQFEPLKKIATSSKIGSYLDKNPSKGWNYYRIKGLGDNETTYSLVQAILFLPKAKILKISPNPTQESVYLEWENEVKQPTHLQIFDSKGQLVRKQYLDKDFFSTKSLEVKDLEVGVYFIQLIGETVFVGKLIKS